MRKEVAMRETIPARLDLERRALFTLDDPSNLNFICRTGTVWITLDGDQRDYVLEAGDCFRTAEHRRALIYALAPTRVDLVTCQESKNAMQPSRTYGRTSTFRAAH